ncbi:MAG TPA: DUF4097 family beta strand repeat-containing protein [Vicinamibacterales bacterium]|nr:DUF4097 family beta strand repeat-containing protein [Vicinamibacterales bacterium]
MQIPERATVGVVILASVALATAAPARAQDVRVRVQVDPAVVAELQSALQDVLRSDVGREISAAVRDAVRETTRAIPEVAKEIGRTPGAWQDRNFRVEQTDTEKRTLTLGANGTLDLKNVSGDITVTAGSGRDTTVEIVRRSRGRTDADAKLGLEQVKVSVDARGERASVEAHYPNMNRPPYSVTIDYNVVAPAGTHLTIRSISGDVSIKGIKTDAAVDVVSGTVKISDGGLSSATTISGDVTLMNVTTDATVNVGSVSGEVKLDQIKCRRLSASIVSGTVAAHEITCGSADLKSMSGDVEYSGPLAKGGRYELQTHSGDARLTVTGSVGFDLQASTFSGEIKLTPPLQLQGASISRHSARGTVGDGGATVVATAFSGDVVIIKK